MPGPLGRLREVSSLLRPLLPPSLLPAELAQHGWRQAEALAILRRSGLLRFGGPGLWLAVGQEVARWGLSPVTAFEVSAAVEPQRAMLVDDLGAVSFGELERWTNGMAAGLQAAGVKEGAAVGILCRNGRAFVEGALALWKLGADSVYLNTSFSAPELVEIARSERLTGIIHDGEFSRSIPNGLKHWPVQGRRASLQAFAELNEPPVLKKPSRPPRHVILTSGTTGRARGAPRSTPSTLEPALALLSRIPLRVGEPTLIGPPLFHMWGFAHLTLGLLLSSTTVLMTRFDPEAALAAIEKNRVTAFIAVPVMLQRIMELPARTRRRYDHRSLRVVAVSGSPLSAELAARFMDEFGDIVYNLYGSTEVAWASIATPGDLREAPGTAGRPPRRTVVRIYGEDGRPVATGERGQIYVGNELLLDSYSSGEKKDSIDGLMSTGDLGRLDGKGRLFVEGRGDEMIVSGGENVYPAEVEDVIKSNPAVADAAVVGVDDPQFGQALKAVVVARRGRLTEEQVLKHVRSRVARFKVPRQVVFVDELPRNPAGKVLKEQLKDGAVPRQQTKHARRRPAAHAGPRRQRAPGRDA